MGIFRRSIVVAAVIQAAVILAPCHAGAQSSSPSERLTADIAEHALAPGTTRDAAEAWLRHWGIDYDDVSLEKCCFLLGKPELPAGTRSILEGGKVYPFGGISADIIEVYIFFDADNRVLRVLTTTAVATE